MQTGSYIFKVTMTCGTQHYSYSIDESLQRKPLLITLHTSSAAPQARTYLWFL